MILRKPLQKEFSVYKKLELEFYLHHKPYKTLLQDIDPLKRNLKKEFLEILKDKNSFFRFAEQDSKVVGYVYGVIQNIEDNEKGWKKIGDLNSILVLKEYRTFGIGKSMAEEFFKWLKKHRVSYVKASCNVKNKAVHEFNKKLGFKEQFITFGKIL
ncbi:MAG: GNAT family N-acetyltransferase [Candidatus Woesearchaeota archaeon]